MISADSSNKKEMHSVLVTNSEPLLRPFSRNIERKYSSPIHSSLRIVVIKVVSSDTFYSDRNKIRQEVLDAIEDSRTILSLEDDWDEEGAPGYKTETWQRATGFLQLLARADCSLPIPRISPAGNGSIDLYWRLEKRTLLVNFPASGSDPIFFGKTFDGQVISGRIPGAVYRPDLVTWLAAK